MRANYQLYPLYSQQGWEHYFGDEFIAKEYCITRIMSSIQIDFQLDISSFVTIYYHINTGLTRNTNDDDNARNP